MAEYIERGKLLRDINHYHLSDGKFQHLVEVQQAADVAPVRHGRWIGAPICGNDNCRCSECGSWHNLHANLRGEIMQKYCPNCGAKMGIKDGGDNDAAD